MFPIRVLPSLYSLPAFPFPRSLPKAISGACDSHESPPLQFCAFPSLLFPSLCSLPSFPIDDYVPALFPYWRLCSRPLFLFSIMLPFSFPYFWLCPDTLCPWCPYVTFARLLEMQFLCSKCLSERTGQLLFVTYSKVPHYFSAGEPSWNNGCSRTPK